MSLIALLLKTNKIVQEIIRYIFLCLMFRLHEVFLQSLFTNLKPKCICFVTLGLHRNG